MIGLNYVTRRGAIYVWRRRLPAWVSRTMYLQISLRTANENSIHPARKAGYRINLSRSVNERSGPIANERFNF